MLKLGISEVARASRRVVFTAGVLSKIPLWRSRAIALSACCAAAASGCASDIPPLSRVSAAPVVAERAALDTAVADLLTTAWPTPERASLTERLTGVVAGDGDRVTRDDAIEAYVKTLNEADAPFELLLADVNATLLAAQRLELTAEEALAALDPRMSDVAGLERAIRQLRESRSIYLASLKRIDAPSDDLRDTARARIKTEFDAAARAIGDLADSLADRAHVRRSDDFLGPDAPRPTVGL